MSLAPEYALAHACLATVQIHTNRAALGIRECERALELDRNQAGAHGNLGSAKIVLGRAGETEAHILQALRLSPHDTIAHIWRTSAALAKFSLGQDEEAVDWLLRSIETNRTFPSSRFLLAATLAHLGRLPEARSEVQAGLAILPTYTIGRFRATASRDHPTVVAMRERYIDGLRKAGVPEE